MNASRLLHWLLLTLRGSETDPGLFLQISGPERRGSGYPCDVEKYRDAAQCTMGTPIVMTPPYRHDDCVWLEWEGWRYAPENVPGAAGDIALWTGQYDGRYGQPSNPSQFEAEFQRRIYEQAYEEGRSLMFVTQHRDFCPNGCEQWFEGVCLKCRTPAQANPCSTPPRQPGDPGYTSADIHCEVYGTDQHPMDPGHPRWQAPGAHYPDPSTVYPTQPQMNPPAPWPSGNPIQSPAQIPEPWTTPSAGDEANPHPKMQQHGYPHGYPPPLAAAQPAVQPMQPVHQQPGAVPTQQVRAIMSGGTAQGVSRARRRAIRRMR